MREFRVQDDIKMCFVKGLNRLLNFFRYFALFCHVDTYAIEVQKSCNSNNNTTECIWV